MLSTSSPTEALASTTSSPRSLLPRFIILGAALVAFVAAFVIFPYQEWNSQKLESVMVGWHKLLSQQNSADWQFCYVVPFITGFLVWRERDLLKKLPIQGSWWGILVLMASTICYWLGFKVGTGYMGYAAVQLFFSGWIILFGGMTWMRKLFLPWLFLLFSWPLFPLDDLVAARLKIPTAWSAEQILNLVGVDTVRIGSTLESRENIAAGIARGQAFRLDVADSCSGMRSLYSLIMVSMLYSIVGLKGTFNRALLTFSAIPLAVVGNVVRLLILAFGCLLFGQEVAVGKQVEDHQEDSFYHMFAGFLVFGVALFGMFTIATWLEGKHWKSLGKKKRIVKSATPWQTLESPTKLGVRALAMLATVALAFVLCKQFATDSALSKPGVYPRLPSEVLNYSGNALTMSLRERQVFDPGVTLERREYLSYAGSRIVGTLVMSGGKKKSLHTPELCLPDQGWTIAKHEEVPIQLKDGREFKASIMSLYRDVQIETGEVIRVRALNLYWYIGSNGVVTPSYKMSHMYTYRDSIVFNFNHHWSQAAFYMPLPEILASGQDLIGEIVASQQLREFAQAAAEDFMIP